MKMEIPKNPTVCVTCGFVKEIPREVVLLKSDMISLLRCEDNMCKECGHQKDGSTIPIVHKHIQKLGNKLIRERNAIWKFIHAYHLLNEEQKKDTCVKLPRFMKPNFKSKGDFTDDIEEPYSWNVAWMEIKHNTDLGWSVVLQWMRDNEKKNNG